MPCPHIHYTGITNYFYFAVSACSCSSRQPKHDVAGEEALEYAQLLAVLDWSLKPLLTILQHNSLS